MDLIAITLISIGITILLLRALISLIRIFIFVYQEKEWGLLTSMTAVFFIALGLILAVIL